MGLLDEILKHAGGLQQPAPSRQASAGGVGSIAEMLMRNPQIIAAALALLNHRDTSVGGSGGLADLVTKFNRGGLGDVMSSWVGGGPNQPVSPGDLEGVLGPEVLGQFSQRAGIGQAEAGNVLAQVLPELVNHMTPQGQVPQGGDLENVLGSLLGQLGRRS